MAATYLPSAAYNEANWFVRNMLNGDVNNYVKYSICDQAIKTVWTAAPWRWSIGLLANTVLTTATDYNIASTPADFLRLEHAYWTDGNTVQQMEVAEALPATPVIQGQVRQVALVPGTPNILRVFPPMGSLGGQSISMVTYYKKVAPTITSANFSTAGAWVIDDDYIPVVYAFVLYYALLSVHDPRAGGAEWDEEKRAFKYSGQLATAWAGIEDMRRREPMPLEWNHQPDRKADRR